MLISCPNCASTYDVPEAFFPAGGRIVRCADCRECWLVEPAPASRDGGKVLHLFGPEIVAEARSARRPSVPRRPARPHPRARLAGSLRRSRGAAAAVSLGLMVVLAMAGVARKDDVVRVAPQSAALFAAIGLPVNLRGLALASVEGVLSPAQGSARPVLTLEGTINNLRTESTPVPRLRFSLRDKGSHELYSWTAPAPTPRLGAGESIAFRSRLAAPPEEGRDLVVSFADAAESREAKPETR